MEKWDFDKIMNMIKTYIQKYNFVCMKLIIAYKFITPLICFD